MKHRRKRILGALGVGGLGAAAMYLLDPQSGRRRRAVLVDKTKSLGQRAGSGVAAGARDLGNRARGLGLEAVARVRRQPVADEVLEARVRSRIGHFVPAGEELGVEARDGRVKLSGSLPPEAAETVVRAARSVRGVSRVTDDVERNGDAVGGGSVGRRRWRPSGRLLGGAAGGALAATAPLWGGVAGVASAAAGLGLLARSATNRRLGELVGLEGRRGLIPFSKTLHVDAPLSEVFELWRDFELFPRFMNHVRSVEPVSEGRWRWTVDGPGGVPVSWEAIVTEMIPNEILAWKSVDGSRVRHRGQVRFIEEGESRTRLDVSLAYNPPGGAVGHLVASLAGRSPAQEMDADLVRMKSLLEDGRTSTDAGTVTREELEARRDVTRAAREAALG